MCPSAAKKKETKKARSTCSESFSPDNSLKFWGHEQKIKYESLQKRPLVPDRVINLEQFEASHCTVSSFFRVQKLSLLLELCGLELYEEHVRLFYANLRISQDSGELQL
ncbi:hypothetical protein RDI58_014613 [Solanum bulbocastanum]|uniref:Uncharacterized protein n=1 Tax=Solanum bulbocastanum TaxID=147425 RepID=A0AAN8YE39_SOLBU